MTFLQRVHYIWVRVGAALFVLMPVAMWLSFRPWGLPDRVLDSDEVVRVADRGDAIVFEPHRAARRGLLLLPGCPVDPQAYAPLARGIAAQGYASAVIKIPYRCAPSAGLETDLDRRVEAFVAARSDTRWVLAGHSRGAVHAARIIQSRAAAFAALVLIGTSHPRDRDLSRLTIPVMKIAATSDGVAGDAQFDTNRLPPATTWIRIDGGNHAQFAYYGWQLFDGRASITREDQHAQVLAALLRVLVSVEGE